MVSILPTFALHLEVLLRIDLTFCVNVTGANFYK